MTRATRESLAHATTCLEQLAYGTDGQTTNPAYHDVVMLLDLLVWLATDIEYERAGAAAPSGASGIHVFGGPSRPVEGKLEWGTETGSKARQPWQVEPSDQMLRRFRGMQRDWHHQLGHLVDLWKRDAKRIANRDEQHANTG